MVTPNPLTQDIELVRASIAMFKTHVREFYFRVVLGDFPCVRCGRIMAMTGPSECTCVCGFRLDPTLEFQRSTCCDARLRRARSHYVCTDCGAVVPSRFLFDEVLLDRQYFRDKMSECRERKRRRRQELRLLLAASRSHDLQVTDTPDAATLSELAAELDRFVGDGESSSVHEFLGRDDFRMEDYRKLVLAHLDAEGTRFIALPAICEDLRVDRVRRFTALIFMEQAREVWLEQRGDDIVVTPYEVDVQG